jgi:hypothetical protein
MVKGYLIDVKKETVEEVLIEKTEKGSTLQGLYNSIGCTNVECVSIDSENDLWVDGEGLFDLTDESKFIQLEGFPQPLCGNGVVLGLNEDNGESVDSTLTLEQVKSKVKFLTIGQVRNGF